MEHLDFYAKISGLNPEDCKVLEKDLDKILKFTGILQQVDVTGIKEYEKEWVILQYRDKNTSIDQAKIESFPKIPKVMERE